MLETVDSEKVLALRWSLGRRCADSCQGYELDLCPASQVANRIDSAVEAQDREPLAVMVQVRLALQHCTCAPLQAVKWDARAAFPAPRDTAAEGCWLHMCSTGVTASSLLEQCLWGRGAQPTQPISAGRHLHAPSLPSLL